MKLCLCVILLVLVVHSWADGALSNVVIGLVGGQVTLPCSNTDKASIVLKNIRFHWQRSLNRVAYAFDHGRYDPTSWDVRYQVSEGQVRKGVLSLQIRNLTVADEDLYTCVLFTKVPELLKTFQCDVRLRVAAHFSVPVISEAIRPGGEVNLICRSWGGYPEPMVNWTDGEGNPLLGDNVVTSLWFDPTSSLWNVTSVLSINTTTQSFFNCSIHNSLIPNNRISAGWMSASGEPNSSKPQTDDPASGYLTAVYVLLAVLVIAAILTIVICWAKRREVYTDVPIEDRMERCGGDGDSSTETRNL